MAVCNVKKRKEKNKYIVDGIGKENRNTNK